MIAIVEPVSPPSCHPAPPKPLSRVEALTKTVSATRLGLWQTCRLKFYFKRVLGIEKPSTPARHVGKVVHAVLQAWSKARWRKEPFVLEQFKSFFETTWARQQQEEPVRWKDQEAPERTGAWSLLEMYFTQTPIPPDEKPEAVEVPVEADLSAHGLPTLVGILDLVRAGGRIVDFKTAAQKPSAQNAIHLHQIQTTAYAVLYREATGHAESGIELHHLIKTKVPKLVVTPVGPMTDQQQSRLFRCIESYVEGVTRQDFVPSPGFHCAACDCFHECGRWSGKEIYA